MPAGQGRTLRAMVAGEGDDLVVLEAGLGVSGLYWGPVHAELAHHTRVVAYERAGYGASSPAAAEHRALPELAEDLRSVVQAFPHRHLVLVGHSWGGPIVRTFADDHRASGESVDGLVLVDQSDEHALALYVSRPARVAQGVQNALLVPLARVRLLAPLVKTQVSGLPRDVRDAAVASSSTVAAARAAVGESRHVAAGLRALSVAPPTLAGIPLRVVSGVKGEHHSTIRRQLIAAHRETVAQYPEARFVPAEHSDHMIPVSEPGVIVEQVRDLLA